MFVILPFGCYSIFMLILGVTALIRRTRGSVIIFAGFLALPFLIMFLSWLLSTKIPDKDDIIGEYEIDRSKFPGVNADWQHQTYTLQITENKVIMRDARTKTIWKSKISWNPYTDYLWSFSDNLERHHMIANGPTLYRRTFSHYYVFESPLYGNVFFKKK